MSQYKTPLSESAYESCVQVLPLSGVCLSCRKSRGSPTRRLHLCDVLFTAPEANNVMSPYHTLFQWLVDAYFVVFTLSKFKNSDLIKIDEKQPDFHESEIQLETHLP